MKKEKMNKLKPCPFCGSENIVGYGYMSVFKLCRDCLARGPVMTPDPNERTENVYRKLDELWNKRK